MEKEVRIRVAGLHTQNTPENEKDQNPVEVLVPGEYYCRNGIHYLKYEETVDEGSAPVMNLIRIAPDSMEVRKKGPVSSRMVFERGRKTSAEYAGPYGTIHLGIDTTALSVREGEGELEVLASYTLDMDGAFASDCSLQIQARNRKD